MRGRWSEKAHSPSECEPGCKLERAVPFPLAGDSLFLKVENRDPGELVSVSWKPLWPRYSLANFRRSANLLGEG